MLRKTKTSKRKMDKGTIDSQPNHGDHSKLLTQETTKLETVINTNLPNGHSSPSLSESSSYQVDSDIPLDFYLERLKSLKKSPYREYCETFLSTLCAAHEVATIITSGKIELSEPKRQQAFNYGISILGDAGGVFAPTGTIVKATTDIASHFFDKARKERYAHVGDMAANPVHYILFSQALVDCLLFYFELSWGNELTPKYARKEAEILAKELIRKIKAEELIFPEESDLSQRLKLCVEYIVTRGGPIEIDEKDAPVPLQDGVHWKKDRYEDILLLATAQTLNFAPDYFLKVDASIEKLEKLERKVANTRNNKMEARAQILEDGAEAEDAIFTNAESTAYQLEIPKDITSKQSKVLGGLIEQARPNKATSLIVPRGAKANRANFTDCRATAFSVKVRSEEPSVIKHSRESTCSEENRHQQSPTRSRDAFLSYQPQQPPYQEDLINKVESLIKQIYSGDSERYKIIQIRELSRLNELRGRRLSQGEFDKLKQYAKELNEDFLNINEHSNETGNSLTRNLSK